MTEVQQVRLFRMMESYVEGLAREDFVPSPGFHCAGCEFLHRVQTLVLREETMPTCANRSTSLEEKLEIYQATSTRYRQWYADQEDGMAVGVSTGRSP